MIKLNVYEVSFIFDGVQYQHRIAAENISAASRHALQRSKIDKSAPCKVCSLAVRYQGRYANAEALSRVQSLTQNLTLEL